MSSLPRGSSATRGPSNEEWLSHRGLIRQLYLVENKTLKEVMGTMLRKHRFIATYAILTTNGDQY
jgi:Clr5 domain